MDYFRTDWGAMTLHDWLGLIITVSVFLIFLFLFWYVLHPSNKEKFESRRHIPLDEENSHLEDQR